MLFSCTPKYPCSSVLSILLSASSPDLTFNKGYFEEIIMSFFSLVVLTLFGLFRFFDRGFCSNACPVSKSAAVGNMAGRLDSNNNNNNNDNS